MKALHWLKAFAKVNRKLVVSLVAAVAVSAGVPAIVANPGTIEIILQGIENAQAVGSAETLGQ